MNKIFSLTGALAVAATLTLSGCGIGPETGPPSSAGSVPSTASGMAMPDAGSMELMIHIKGGKFIDPKPLSAGATVTVMNMEGAAQTVVSDDSTSFNVSIPAGGIANFVAPKKPGSYPFHSETADMHGVLTVLSTQPSQAATMVCADEAKKNVKEILALPDLPRTTDNWDGTTFSCTYPLSIGDFRMTVTEAGSEADAAALAKQLAVTLQAHPIEGLSNLGLPGYESGDGTVIFVKDNMMLHVDATAFPATVGPHKVTASNFAYEVATTILGCWTEHHG
ncbi:hypothetical protein AAGW05_16530 [Arthrobacter sp. LAPM80]|uniref:hypothetical protein n=1 Tax=Arthrobacter sp. LAPM80 TaxID=3141788 RepID=UPI00398B9628